MSSASSPIRFPSRSLSATSKLATLVARGRAQLKKQLGPIAAGPAGPTATPASSAATLNLDDPGTFEQLPYGSLFIDCSWTDLLYAYQACLVAVETANSRRDWHERIAALFRLRHNVHATHEAAALAVAGASVTSPTSSSLAAPVPLPLPVNVNGTLPSSYIAPSYLLAEHNILTALSARTCLDLYLASRAFPSGSYVLLSAINIPDISVVLRAHGLVPVPVDIHTTTLEPDLALLDQAAGRVINGKKVVAVLVAHLFGRRFDVGGVAQIAAKHHIDLIEDLAESFSGFEYAGHPSSDLSLFSFGSIKVCTGFGCGIARVRSRGVYEDMSRMQTSWDVQTRQAFFTKCVKNTLTMLVLNVPLVTGGVIRSARALNIDHRGLVVQMLRGFPDRLMERLRTQPSSALLSMLHRRLSSFDPNGFQLHQDTCDLMIELLPGASHCVPGLDAPVRNHWLFPVLVDHIDEVLKELNDAGVDVYKGATQLALVPTPEEVKDQVPFPSRAADLMSRVVYLPVHKNVPFSAIVRMAAVMHRVVQKVEAKHAAAAPRSKL